MTPRQKKTLYVFGGITLLVLIMIYFSGLATRKITSVLVTDSTGATSSAISPAKKKAPVLFEYISVTDSCGPSYAGACVNVRSGPSVEDLVVFKLRTGQVLQVDGKVTRTGKDWYKISFKDEWLRYPERVKTDLYVSADFVSSFFDEGTEEVSSKLGASDKRIIVDRSEQTLYAYENDVLFMKEKVSTGILLTPTPRGTFAIFKKSPSRYMQGPIPGISDHYYDLPGVPWNLYFTEQGAVIHGAYWHDKFGQPWSNGCVNVPVESAEKLYRWADVGTKVIVRD